MYKKLLLSVAVLISYNATTLSSEEGNRLWSETQGCLGAGLKSGVISLLGSCILAKEAPLTKEALMPHVCFAGIAAAAGGAISVLNRLSKYLNGPYTKSSVVLLRDSSKNLLATIPMTNIPMSMPMTSILGILGTAAYYKYYA